MVNVGVRNLAGSFRPMDGEVVNFHPKTERNDVEFAEFNPSPGHLFQSRDQTAVNAGLKRVSAKVNNEGKYQENKSEQRPNYQPAKPTPSRFRLVVIQRPPPPECPAVAEGVRMSLSDRSVRIQLASRSLILCCARSSRILGATCSSGTSTPPL